MLSTKEKCSGDVLANKELQKNFGQEWLIGAFFMR